MTYIKLYKTVFIPTALYGCELWSNITKQYQHNLNVFQHYINKRILNVPNQTRSDISHSYILWADKNILQAHVSMKTFPLRREAEYFRP